MQSTSCEKVLVEAGAEVMESMFFMECCGVEIEPPAQMSSWLGSRLEFHGSRVGSFKIAAPLRTARAFAANFLSDDVENIEAKQVNDVLGESANMICGSVLSRVDGIGIYQLSHPEPWEGAALSSVSSWLKFDEGLLWLDWQEDET